MVTMLDCIERVPSLLKQMLEGCRANFDGLFEAFDPQSIDELYFIGSGSSYNGAATARYLAERASGVRVTVALPNEFLHGYSVRNPHALYLFISQTGTSTVTMDAMRYANAHQLMTAAVSEHVQTPLAKEAAAFVNMGCGHEEFGMRTIGYSTTVATLMLLGVELGRRRGSLDASAYQTYMAQAGAAVQNIPAVIEGAQRWMDASRRRLLRSQFISFTGSRALYGVAMEAAVKVWEAPQYPSAGYELDEGMHGPNYGYNCNHAVIVLCDGGADTPRAVSLARYMKNEHKNGYIIGTNAIDQHDLCFEPKGGEFACLEFAAAIQVLMYRMAVDGGRDFSVLGVHAVMNSYFQSHNP